MTSKLALYNLALGTYIGSQTLARIDENVASRYALDRVYDDVLTYVLEQGLWKFALRTADLTADRDDATMHRQYAYPIPDDFVRLAGISATGRFDNTGGQLENYVEEAGVWYSDSPTLWVQYVSNDATRGLNLDAYPANYTQAVASWLAYQSLLPVSKDRGDRADVLTLHKQALANARRLDAVDEAVKQKPAGRWPRSRGFSMNGTTRGLR